MTGLFTGTAMALAAGSIWGLSLALADEAGHQVLGISAMTVSMVGALGMVLSKGRWSLNVTRATMLVLVALPLLTRPGWWIAGSTIAALALVVSLTAWGQEGLRKLPPAAPIPDQAIILSIGLLALPGLAAIGQLEEGGIGLVVWTGFVFALALFYSRALQVGLWGARFGLPLSAIALAIDSPFPANLLVVLGAIGLTAIAWHPQTLMAITDAAPKAVAPVVVPPELVPEELMRAAGYDSSGRRLGSGNDV